MDTGEKWQEDEDCDFMQEWQSGGSPYSVRAADDVIFIAEDYKDDVIFIAEDNKDDVIFIGGL